MDLSLAERKRKVKSILVSQPESQAGNNPYMLLAEKHKLKIDFRPFIQVKGVSAAEFRKDKIALGDFKAFIFTSRNAIDHFFRMCEEMRVAINPEWKYFCTSEAVAFYLQKFVPYRKRKIYPAKSNINDLVPTLKKQRGEHFLMPTSDVLNPEVPSALESANIKWTRAIMYQTVASDLSDLNEVKYDMLVFFSPEGIKSLFKNFPNFVQDGTRIAAFGSTTHQAAREHNLILDVPVPSPKFASMAQALEAYVDEANKSK
ncbi:MAG: uroporphyrinogen-III synthase [Bacteroidetes bacterium]|nr:uroporphyrinogen-III synthase [Bacteroidota bacterium]